MNRQRMDDDELGSADIDVAHEQAADWFARLRESNVSLEDTLEWQAWMSADTRHAEAFARIEEVSTVLRSMPRPALPPSSVGRNDRYDASIPLSTWLDTAGARAGLLRNRRRVWLGAIAASVVLASTVLGWAALNRDALGWTSAKASAFETIVGENRVVTLSDGSRVTLGGATTLRVAMSEHERRIELARGEAFFSVAKDASRPFRVHAGDATVVAVGTEFNVRRGKDRVVVSVVEGRVNVEPASRLVPIALLRELKPRLVTVKVSAGQQTIAADAGVEPAVQLPDAAVATSWQTGRLTFRLQPLRYVIEDVNRYAPKPIVIEDERIAARLFTGTVMGSNVMGWIGSLESAFGIEAVEEPGRIVLRAR
ncbi:MAG: FecR domain-containing protein [Gammaproteobacteria bacterium]